MGSAPVKSAPVKEPKKAPAWGASQKKPPAGGAKVVIREPMASGTIIMPPGIRSTVRLMGICIASSRYMGGRCVRVREEVAKGAGITIALAGLRLTTLTSPTLCEEIGRASCRE